MKAFFSAYIYIKLKPEAFFSPRLYAFLVLFLLSATANAQEVVDPLQSNEVLKSYYPEYFKKKSEEKKRSKHGEPHTLKLPFFDDFSNSFVYPNDTVWWDKYVFINYDLAENAPSTGFATFDGLNYDGQPYEPGSISTQPRPTDTLTSTYIDISKFENSDSIYLSFYYQPGGFGDAPEGTDSFVLQFKPDSLLLKSGKWDTLAWFNVWSVKGSANAPFKLVMVPVKNISNGNFLHNKFQFRFLSYGNQSGQIDHWHLDYIYINQGRSLKDTSENIDLQKIDAAVYKPTKSILKKYSSLTIKQFLAGSNMLVSDIPIYTTNNSNQVKNVAFGYNIVDRETGDILTSFVNAQGENVGPREHRRLEMLNKFTPTMLTGKTKAVVEINTSVTSIPDDFRVNDTATHVQVFDDYMAYDDGTAEGAYGITGTQLGKVALRFTLNTADTLYGFSIHFSQAEDFVGNNFVNLAVWKQLTPVGTNENDQPAARINFVRPQYVKKINGFYYFQLPEPLPVDNEFYIGWMQSRDFNLKVGFDKNYPEIEGNTSNIFYSVAGKWEQSKQKGTPMIRAYVSQRPVFVGDEETSRNKPQSFEVIIYPNPTNGQFTVAVNETGLYNIDVLDITGKVIFSTTTNSQSRNIDLRHFQQGIYMVKVTDINNGSVSVKKLIIR